MTTQEIQLAVKTLVGCFPQADLQPVELSIFVDEFRRYPPSVVNEVIRRHRQESEYPRPTVPRVFSMLRATGQRQRVQRQSPYQSVVAKRFIDLNPAWSGRPEAEVIAGHYRQEWRIWYQRTEPRVARGTMLASELQAGLDLRRDTARRSCVMDVSDALAIPHDSPVAVAWGQVAAAADHELSHLVRAARAAVDAPEGVAT